MSSSASVSSEAATEGYVENRSVSDLLSSFYDVDNSKDDDSQEEECSSNSVAHYPGDDVALSGTIFGKEDFNVSECLNTVLKKYSMVDLIVLLRRLEREVRQFTAGKQLLIYDNYECLFTALDTVHEINDELIVVQKHLQALKASQIKASSIDISSRYGIREKLVKFSELNRLLNIFQVLASIANCLCVAREEASSKLESKAGVLELLRISAKVFVLLKTVQERCGPKVRNIQLFHTFNKYAMDLMSQIIKRLNKMLKSEYVSHNELISICCNLAKSRLVCKQVWEYYWVSKSFVLRQKLESILKLAKTSTTTLYVLSNDIVDFVLSVVEAVWSEGYSNLVKHTEANKCNEPPQYQQDVVNAVPCMFCIGEDFELYYHADEIIQDCGTRVNEYETNYLTHSFCYVKLLSEYHCKCMRGHVGHQVASLYVQLAFASLQYRMMSTHNKSNTNEVVFLLTSMLDKFKAIRKDDSLVRYITNISSKWILLIILLYLQKLFYPIYNALSNSVLSPEQQGQNAFKALEIQVDAILKEDVTEMLTIVDDLSNVMHTSLRPLFSSYLMLYIINLKNIFRALYKGCIVSYESQNNVVDRLASLSLLTSLRGNSGTTRLRLINEHMQMKRSGAYTVLCENKPFVYADESNNDKHMAPTVKAAISVDHYLEMLAKRKTNITPFTSTTLRHNLSRVILSMYDFDTVFERILKRAMEKVGRPSTVVTNVDIHMAPQAVNAVMPEHLKKNLQAYLSTFVNDGHVQNYFEKMFNDDRIHLTAILSAVDQYDKGTVSFTIPMEHLLTDKSENDVNLLGNEEPVKQCPFDLTQSIISYVMNAYIAIANRIVRVTMEGIESEASNIDAAIKDFTGMMYEMIEFLDSFSDAAPVDEATKGRAVELNKKLSDIICFNDIRSLSCVYLFPFLPSKELCLKLFTIRIAQLIADASHQHVVNTEHLKGILARIEMQLLVAFRKSTDIDQMKRAFGKLAYSDVM